MYAFWDFSNAISCYTLPTITQNVHISLQEVLSADNVAFQFSGLVEYRVTDGKTLLQHISISEYLISELENMLYSEAQLFFRKKFAEVSSEEILQNHAAFTDFSAEEFSQKFAKMGVEIERITVRDITFPKRIQEIFAKDLESKMRAKVDLENARTLVATARTMKNAAAMLEGSDGMKFLQLLEAMRNIAEKGNHTFVIGNTDMSSKV